MSNGTLLVCWAFVSWMSAGSAAAAAVIDFEDASLTLAPNSFYNGADGAGGFASRGAWFKNDYLTQYQSWYGWSYTNTTNTTTPGPTNQYSSWAGGGASGSTRYGVAYLEAAEPAPEVPLITLPAGLEPIRVAISNTTYAALSMRHGDSFAKKFGGATGNDPDYFKLTILAVDGDLAALGSVEYYLADYRFTDNGLDFIRAGWNTIELAPLRGLGATHLTFAVDSSDVGPFGINTPAYFALDDLLLAAPGDADLDGHIGRADAVAIADQFGAPAGANWEQGDFDGDGAVTLADVSLLKASFAGSATATAAASFVVAEPSGAALGLIGLAGMAAILGFHKRRGTRVEMSLRVIKQTLTPALALREREQKQENV